ncbi:MAG TPA: DUF2461 domain-containing protein, partial [Actinopolymorphaceae bacterium]
MVVLQDVADADPRYDDFFVWGYGKTAWWWQHQSAMVRIAPQVELGVRFDLDGLWVRGVWWYAPPAMLARYRAAVADDTTGDELLRHRSLGAARALEGDEWLHTPEAVDRVLATFAEHRPLLVWFADHVAVDAVTRPG